MKNKIHNEWFQPIVKRSCPCNKKKTDVFAWGEYVCGKWRTVDYFCESCFESRVVSRLISHKNDCGCSFALVARSGYSIPAWIKMPEICKAA